MSALNHLVHDELAISQVEDHYNAMSEDDKAAQAAIGKDALLERRFSFWTALSMTVCMSATWEGIGTVTLSALSLGGPVGLLYGYIVVAVAMSCVAASLAELASIWPSAGAQYHWAAALAPPKYRAILSWIAGWVAFTYAWLGTVTASVAFSVQVQAFIVVAHPDVDAQRWWVYMFHLFTMTVAVLVNIFGVKILHTVNMAAIVTHVIGFFMTMIVLLVCTDVKSTTSYVFTEWTNSSGWDSKNVAFCIGLLTPLFGFSAIETAAHFAEEIKHVTRSLPRAIFWTVCTNAVITFPWLISVLYCMGNVDVILSSPIAALSPMTPIFINSTGNIGAGIFMTTFITYIGFIAALNSLGSCSRTMWAMARDGALPAIFTRVHPKYNVPILCIATCAIFQILLPLIYIGNTTAFYGITSGTLILMNLSYMIPIGLHVLYARPRKMINYGPWHLGRFSTPVNLLALGWTIFMCIFLAFPQYQPVDAANMNYAVVILAFFLVFFVLLYFTYGRGRFKGPILEGPIDGLETHISQDIGLTKQPTTYSVKGNGESTTE